MYQSSFMDYVRRFFNPKQEVIYQKKRNGYILKVYAIELLNGKWALYYDNDYIFEGIEFLNVDNARAFFKNMLKQNKFMW